MHDILTALTATPSTSTVLPPTPLTTLISTDPSVTGAVLTGYDVMYVGSTHHTIYDTPDTISVESLALAATLASRAIYADSIVGSSGMSISSASSYAALAIPAVSPSDPTLLSLSDCFLTSGSSCSMVKDAVEMEAKRSEERTGYELGYTYPLGEPPNYYTSVYGFSYSQPWVYIDGEFLASTTRKTSFDSGGFIQVRVSELEATVKSLLNSYLHPPESFNTTCIEDVDCGGNDADCEVKSVCTMGKCACDVAHYHPAYDRGLKTKNDTSLWYAWEVRTTQLGLFTGDRGC